MSKLPNGEPPASPPKPPAKVTVADLEAKAAVRTLLAWIGEDPDREGLRDTPDRFVRALAEATSGYETSSVNDLLRTFDGEGYTEPVVITGIRVVSTCEHHLAPFEGTACVGYLPGKKGKIVGLSKLARVVDVFAKRLQVQERLTRQVARAIMDSPLEPYAVGVVIRARHSCMSHRGAAQPDADTETRALLGGFTIEPLRSEFLRAVR